MKILLWIILAFLCWPIALVVLILYPILWLLLLPFKVVGISIDALLRLLKAILTFPARILEGPSRR